MTLPYPITNISAYYHPIADTVILRLSLEKFQQIEYHVYAELFHTNAGLAEVLRMAHRVCIQHFEANFAPEEPEPYSFVDFKSEIVEPSWYWKDNAHRTFWYQIGKARHFDWDEWVEKSDIHNQLQPVPTKSKDSIGDTVSGTLNELLPGLSENAQCPRCAVHGKLQSVVIHLNDGHKITREELADWLETLDIDLRFKGEVNE